MIYWAIGIAVSIALLVLTAGAKTGNPDMAYAHMLVAALSCAVFAYAAIRSTQRLTASSSSQSAISADAAWHMGYVWVWGALGLLISYGSGVVAWHEWWHFFLAFAGASAAALFFANILQKDADSGKSDEAILKISRYLGYLQLFGMAAVVLGLLIDGKMTRFLVPRHGDWAANNIFFFGAMALGIISAYGLRVSTDKKNTDPS